MSDTSREPKPMVPAPSQAPVVLSSQQLMGKARELLIEHGGEHYRLRITRNGKLILTK